MVSQKIEGYNGYLVTDTGIVLSSKRSKTVPLKPDVSRCTHTNYLRVTLCNLGVTSRHFVHRLVAEAFIPNPENKPYVNHIDNNGENNSVSNLEWCTHSENMLHSHKQGRCSNLIASDTARRDTEGMRIRYAQKYEERLGNRFIHLYLSTEIEQKGNVKPLTAVEYVCSECGITRIGKTPRPELKKFNGVCPNCQDRVELLGEDIV